MKLYQKEHETSILISLNFFEPGCRETLINLARSWRGSWDFELLTSTFAVLVLHPGSPRSAA